MSWWTFTKEKAFCLEAYFANNSYKVMQASFRRKFQGPHAPSKRKIFYCIQKFRECGTEQNLNKKVWGKFILVIFREEHDVYAKGLQWLKLWGMFVRRLKFKTCKVLDVYWIFVGFHIIFKGSVFWVTLYKLRQLNIVRKTFLYSNVQ